MSIETIVLNAVKDKYNVKGDSFRMKHEFKMDGSVCTEQHKDPALVITRDTSGWKWHCHRCHESGFIGDRFIDPVSTLKKLDSIEKPKETYKVKLPEDFAPLLKEPIHGSELFKAINWLWKYNISDDSIRYFGFGYSAKYKMVILPLFSSDKKVIDGWIGRRIDGEGGKYHIQKPKGQKRIYFKIEEDTDECILVEDCLSAIKVNGALGITTIALLTTSVDEDLTRELRGKEVYIWLDADALSKSVAMVSRMRQIGIKAKHIYTTKDPKCYNNVGIMETWDKTQVKEV